MKNEACTLVKTAIKFTFLENQKKVTNCLHMIATAGANFLKHITAVECECLGFVLKPTSGSFNPT